MIKNCVYQNLYLTLKAKAFLRVIENSTSRGLSYRGSPVFVFLLILYKQDKINNY